MTTGRILLIAAIVAIGYYWYSNNQAELQRPALQHQTDLQTQARWEREAAEERAKLEREQAKQEAAQAAAEQLTYQICSSPYHNLYATYVESGACEQFGINRNAIQQARDAREQARDARRRERLRQLGPNDRYLLCGQMPEKSDRVAWSNYETCLITWADK